MPKNNDLHIRHINTDIYRKFKSRCAERGTTVKAAIEEAMQDWVAKQQ